MTKGKRAREEALLAETGTHEENREILRRFVLTREQARINKEAGFPQPWCDDPIISKNHFCNVYRKDDRVTRWLLKHYYPHFAGLDTDLWFHSAAARLINWPPSLMYLLEKEVIPRHIDQWDEDRFKHTFKAFQDRGDKTFTGAYMLYNGARSERNAEPKTFFTAFSLTLLLRHTNDLRAAVAEGTLKKVSDVICRVEGINTFLAGQIVADLTYFSAPGSLHEAVDLYTWAPLGPGSQRGLNWLYCRRPIKKTWKEPEFLKGLLEVKAMFPEYQDLSLHDVQNIMCEYSKYMRIRATKESYRYYQPETAYHV